MLAGMMLTSRVFPFLRLFVPAALTIVFAAWLYASNKYEKTLVNVRSQEILSVTLGASSLLRHTQGIVDDIEYISAHSALQQVLDDPKSPEVHRLEGDFLSFLRAKKVYDQICWLDASGREVIRVIQSDSQPLPIPHKDLKNSEEHPYFKEAMQRPLGEFYLSPLGLAVENNQIKRPFAPILRMAMPVADRHGIKKGLVVINYRGEEMLKRFAAVTRQGAPHMALLDSSGYWLYSPQPEDEWGFTFNDPARSLASRFPASWARMQNVRGQFEDERGLWTYESVFPLGDAIRYLPMTSSASVTGGPDRQYRWLVVSHLEKAKLFELAGGGTREEWGFVGLALLFTGLAIYYLLRIRSQEREAEQRFQTIFDHAMVGIALISLDKRWVEVNPALCRLFGYSAAELTQKNWAELTHPDDLAANEVKFDAVLRGEEEGFSLKKRFIRSDGTILHAFISARGIRKANGLLDYLAVVVEDISDRVRSEAEYANSVQTLQGFIDHLPGAAYIKDADSNTLFANHGFFTFFGLKPEDILGRNSRDVFAGEFGEKIVEDDARILAGGQTETIEESLDGRFYETTKFVIPRDNATPRLGGITLDVTERHMVADRLSQQARRSVVLLDLPRVAEELSEKAFMQYALERAEELTSSCIAFMHFVNDDGVSIELVAWSRNTLEKYCTAAFDAHYPIAEAGIWADAARQKRAVIINDYAGTPDKHGLPEGHSPLVRLLSVPVMQFDQVKMMAGVGNKASDYTDFDVETLQLIANEAWRIVRRQRLDKALNLAMQVVNASPVVCFRWAASEGWPVVFVSENVTQWGFTVADLVAGRPPFADLIHPDDLARIAEQVARDTASGASGYEQEYRLLTAESKVIWVADRTIVRRDAEGRAIFYDGVLTDVTHSKLQQLLLADTLAQQQKLNKRLEEAGNQLLQSEKMASIGQLAAGVAHELNNPIGFVHSNLGTLDGYVHDLMAIIDAYEKLSCVPGVACTQLDSVHHLKDERDFTFLKNDIFSLLSESKDGLSRVRKIVQDLKSFSRVGEQEWQEADLRQGLDSTLNIIWNELKYKCKVVKEYGDIPPVFCLISQLNQVFMNLLLNAGHAIDTQGTIVIRTRCHGDDEVCVEISDTGHGISPEHLNRIFEPFFTTKPVGKGTGLGLSLSYSIVERHRGRIEVDSKPGEGSSFSVYLPIRPAPAPDIQKT